VQDYSNAYNFNIAGSVQYNTNGVFSENVNTNGGALWLSPDIFQNTSNQFTTAFWHKSDSSSELIKKTLAGAALNRFQIDLGINNRLALHLSSTSNVSGDDFFISIPDYSYTDWNHMTIIYNGFQFISYVNGILQGSVSRTLNISNTPYDFVVGGGGNSDGRAVATNNNGNFDNFRLFNRALSGDEVINIYNIENDARIIN